MVTKKKAPIGLIIFSALSFIPLIGVLFGIISIIIGLTNYTRNKIIFILGASGIGFTILIYGTLFIFYNHMEKSGKIDETKIQTTEMFLNNLSNEIENYKCKNGSFPDSLEQVSKQNSMIVIIDMYNTSNTETTDINEKRKTRNYFYKVDKDTFVLFSVGKDGKPFTKDDILPHDEKIKSLGE
ncbi:MAG: type II secretion system protein GspG [Paludibacter sp.]